MRGSVPTLYSTGGRVTGRLNLILIGYTIGITKIMESSISEQIFLDRQGSSHILSGHADLCRASPSVILWARPPLAAQPKYNPMGIGGHTPIGSLLAMLNSHFYRQYLNKIK